MKVASTTALVFPGQGSQSVGMGWSLVARDEMVAAIFKAADETLGINLAATIFEGPAERLQQTDVQQPAIVVTSVAYWSHLSRQGLIPEPLMVAGHSLGQYSALVAAGALSLPVALRLVAERGRLMQEHGAGAMAAVIGMEMDAITEVAARTGVEVANVNAPGQVAISGRADGIDAAVAMLEEKGARRVIKLPVSAAFHSSLMRPVVDELRPLILAAAIEHPSVPVISNVDARAITTADEVRRELLDHICAPVQWVATIEAMQAGGAVHFIEVGPGKVLSGLIKRIARYAKLSDAETLAG